MWEYRAFVKKVYELSSVDYMSSVIVDLGIWLNP